MSGELTKKILNQALQESKLSQAAYDAILLWLTDPQYQDFQKEIIDLSRKKAWDTLEDSFRTTIPFGTGGRRGPRGVGPNRINERTIAESAQGLANYIAKLGKSAKQKGIVIAYDTRIKSEEFAKLTAEVMAGNAIAAYIFSGPRATPELSYAVRYLRTQAGVVISASHNPPSDNGFKVYNHIGGQIIPPEDKAILEEVRQVKVIKKISFEEATRQKFIQLVDPVVDRYYLDTIVKLTLNTSRSAHIVYSPLHGTGSTNVLPILKKLGFSVSVVNEQLPFDGNFSTCPKNIPNPEYTESLSLAIELAKKESANGVIVSDPDADRIGVAVPDAKQKWQILTGNQVGALALEFIGQSRSKHEKPNRTGVVVETIVTSRLIGDIARHWGFKVVDDLLVGFKYIANAIEHLGPDEELIFAAEESLGYLRTAEVRDKDAAQGALTIAECLSWLKDGTKTALDLLDELYLRHGYYKEILHAVSYPGGKGVETMQRIMKNLRQSPPTQIVGANVAKIIDRSIGPPPNDNLLIFYLSENGRNRLAIRPSGTEPKIKVYISCHGPVGNQKDLVYAKQAIDNKANEIVEYAQSLK